VQYLLSISLLDFELGIASRKTGLVEGNSWISRPSAVVACAKGRAGRLRDECNYRSPHRREAQAHAYLRAPTTFPAEVCGPCGPSGTSACGAAGSVASGRAPLCLAPPQRFQRLKRASARSRFPCRTTQGPTLGPTTVQNSWAHHQRARDLPHPRGTGETAQHSLELRLASARRGISLFASSGIGYYASRYVRSLATQTKPTQGCPFLWT